MSDRRVLRSPLDLFVYGALGLLSLFLTAAAAPTILEDSEGGTDTIESVGMLILLLSLSAVLLRASWLRVVLLPDHVRVVNPLRSYRFAWSDIQDVDIVSHGGWFVRIRVDGKLIRTYGLSKFGRFGPAPSTPYDRPDKDAPRWLDQGYNELLQEWKRHRRR